MKDHANRRNFHDTTASDNRKSGNNFSFDGLSAKHKQVCAKKINMTSVVDPDEDEQDHDHVEVECKKIEEK